VILSNDKDEQIYRNFSGRESNKLLNTLKIQEIVLKINEIEMGSDCDELVDRTKNEKILELNNTLVKINREISRCKLESSNLLRKCQLILQKLNIHAILLDLLKHSEKPPFKELTKTVLKFFCLFIEDNDPNCQILADHIDKFVRILDEEELEFIIPSLIHKSRDTDAAHKCSHELISKISKNQKSLSLLKTVDRLLDIEVDSHHTQEFKNHLKRRLLDQIDLKANEKDLQRVRWSDQTAFQYAYCLMRLICKVGYECMMLMKGIKSVYSKCGLLVRLQGCESYREKKLYFMILVEIYVRNQKLENFEIEDYFQVVVLEELQKVPWVFLKSTEKDVAGI
jgi:hypothetical protein